MLHIQHFIRLTPQGFVFIRQYLFSFAQGILFLLPGGDVDFRHAMIWSNTITRFWPGGNLALF
ncbi:MAG: hypothetical protein IJQ62_11345 [Clostridia bacterium]|nr:hypothetical protein [Clostridia bacterium]